jgi:hypothetical protein
LICLVCTAVDTGECLGGGVQHKAHASEDVCGCKAQWGRGVRIGCCTYVTPL